ncbi:uncharacterized protein LOC121255210 [Juglans microcarpa x Juglans regia]|uniref:uncharacterized protein LOC121255210 n=1 Tax=Juglans microcarpa x Juglans regia TaxID=2249226 RepID=UPI001B7E17E7|nr:uncharacterized protein LOC121255210 [Juglans microcarpa x Juglans regia]
METKLSADKCSRLKWRLGYDGCFAVDARGRSGGLALLWRAENQVDVLNYSDRHISAWIRDVDFPSKWLLARFYGELDVARRTEAWEFLESLKPDFQRAWCVLGDFNEILFSNEKRGGKPRREAQMVRFREVLEDCHLHDLGFKEDMFTWSNKHGDGTYTKERLDRVTTNPIWTSMFQDYGVEVLVARSSDHKPLLMKFRGKEEETRRGRNLFKYEEAEDEYNIKEVKEIQLRLGVLLEQENITWKQRAKRHWYKEGDMYTRYFHACATERKKKNTIKRVKGEDDVVRTDVAEIAGAFQSFFTKVYTSSDPSLEIIERCLENVEPRVLAEMNLQLDSVFTRTEVDEAIKQMGPLKSPRPDGFTTRKKGKVGSLALKLDMSKAYDRVECGGEIFCPKRGLRQGDPLSPYLFILCAEGLSSLINAAEKKGDIKGVSVRRGGTSINHLMFADDCILFCRAKVSEWKKIHELLQLYEAGSGQMLNKQKSSFFFSSNTRANEKKDIIQEAGGGVCGSYERYLGLPDLVGRSKVNTFRSIKERIWQKIHTKIT